MKERQKTIESGIMDVGGINYKQKRDEVDALSKQVNQLER